MHYGASVSEVADCNVMYLTVLQECYSNESTEVQTLGIYLFTRTPLSLRTYGSIREV